MIVKVFYPLIQIGTLWKDGAADHGCASATHRVHGHALGSESLLGLELEDAGNHR